MDYRHLSLANINEWCVTNNQTEWFIAKMEETRPFKVYPRKKVVRDGKEVSVLDKTQPYVIEQRHLTFTDIKRDFVDNFMPQVKKVKGTKGAMLKLAEYYKTLR